MIKWHHLFGLVLEDLFTDTGYDIEVEKNLSRKVQLLDIVIVKKKTDSHLPSPLPDGLDNLAVHNLLTYKSLHEPVDDWTLDELLGHYVNYRKWLAGRRKKLPAVDNFRLYAVATRYPEKLAGQVPLETVSAGIYDIRWGLRKIRLIVATQVPDSAANAPWAMFSTNARRVVAGEVHYPWHDLDKRAIVIDGLYERYRKEGIDMAYTTEDFLRHYRESWLEDLSPAERLKGLSPAEYLKGLPPEELLKVLPPEERLRGLSSEELRKALPPEERLKGLPPDALLQALPPELLKALPPEAVEAWLAGREIETKH